MHGSREKTRLYLPQRLKRLLAMRARQEGRSQAELIREALDWPMGTRRLCPVLLGQGPALTLDAHFLALTQGEGLEVIHPHTSPL